MVLFSVSIPLSWEKHWPYSTKSEIAIILLQQLSGLRLRYTMTVGISHLLTETSDTWELPICHGLGLTDAFKIFVLFFVCLFILKEKVKNNSTFNELFKS